MRISLRETKIELFTKCHFLTSDKLFALHDVGPLRVKQKIALSGKLDLPVFFFRVFVYAHDFQRILEG